MEKGKGGMEEDKRGMEKDGEGKAGREMQGEEGEGGWNGMMLRMRKGNYREGWEREIGKGISINRFQPSPLASISRDSACQIEKSLKREVK
jgi:hypothetical protein